MRVLIAVTTFAVCLAAAHADEGEPVADVVCSKTRDIALVRFFYDGAFRPLPSAMDGGLSKDTGAHRTDCTTHWGATIRVRDGWAQPFGYGAGGADPPAFFSLWIDKHHVFSRREWKPGYADIFNEHAKMIVGLVLRPDRLTVCTAKYDLAGHGPTICGDEPLKISDHPVDKYEYPDKPISRRPTGTVYVDEKSLRLDLCRKRLATAGDLGRLASLDAIDPDPPGFLHRVRGSFANVEGLQVFMYSGTDHYFDGDVVVLVPPNVPEADVDAWFKQGDLETLLTTKQPTDWTLIAGGRTRLYPKVSLRYVHFTPQAIDGQLYFLAVPTNWDEAPAAVLVEPHPRGFETSCTFHKVKEHF